MGFYVVFNICFVIDDEFVDGFFDELVLIVGGFWCIFGWVVGFFVFLFVCGCVCVLNIVCVCVDWLFISLLFELFLRVFIGLGYLYSFIKCEFFINVDKFFFCLNIILFLFFLLVF